MAKSPRKSCPNLFRLIEEGETEMFAEFLAMRPFERMNWLKNYLDDLEGGIASTSPNEMLSQEKKDRLAPLETEAARVVKIAGQNGQLVLEGLARKNLDERALCLPAWSENALGPGCPAASEPSQQRCDFPRKAS